MLVHKPWFGSYASRKGAHMLRSAKSDLFVHLRKDKGIPGDPKACQYDDEGESRRNFSEGRTKEVNESICSLL